MTQEIVELYNGYIGLIAAALGVLTTLFSKKVRSIVAAPFIYIHRTFSNKAMETKLDFIVHELRDNCGSSLKDAIKKITVQLDVFSSTFEERSNQLNSLFTHVEGLKSEISEMKSSINDKQANLVAKFTAMLDQPNSPPIFESDKDGKCIWVSSSYVSMVSRPANELLGWGWLNSIHEDDLEHVKERWHECVNEKRIFDLKYRFVDVENRIIHVRCRATPVMNAFDITGWMGVITILPKRKAASNSELLFT
jgi:PAS domain-containing protein